MDLRQGIIEAANALGMSPVDLAAIISYETAGTFDPMKRGPTTQWGQHRGLIQFGEPQARQYGVDWSDPIGSQLGADGAIVRYFRANGWRPGMGLMDAYSVVNAGAPGLYSRSDENNSGAPGTVAEKVSTQFGPHVNKAARFLGVEWTPPPSVDQRTGRNRGNSRLAEQGFTPEAIARAFAESRREASAPAPQVFPAHAGMNRRGTDTSNTTPSSRQVPAFIGSFRH